LWDADRARLVLARDRAGVKPLYFYQQDGRFIFASEIKAILEHPAVSPEINEEALYHYLSFLTTPAPQTLFRDIQKLPAGHLLVIDRVKGAAYARCGLSIAEAETSAGHSARFSAPQIRNA